MLGFFHTACGSLALLLGVLIFAMRKGTPPHVWTGRAYVAMMAGVDLSSFWIYNLTGGPNVFHALAAGSLAMVAVGWAQVLRRRGRWLWRHYQYMAWSYVGLLAATTNEAFVRLPLLWGFTEQTTAGMPTLAMLAVVSCSAVVIFSTQKRMLARYGGAADGSAMASPAPRPPADTP